MRMKVAKRVLAVVLAAAGMAGTWVAGSTRGAESRSSAGQANRPPLVVAVERGRLQDVEQLLKLGADVQVQTPDGVTPLYAAAFHGRDAILRKLIGAGAAVNGRAACGRTPLFPAAAEGKVGAVELLLAAGADPNARSDRSELAQTPLHMAALEGQVETARRLLAAGARVNDTNDLHRITPLYLAVIADRQPVAALLVEHGADAAMTDVFGQTPSRAAALMAGRATRRLLEATDDRFGFDPQAIVVLTYVGLAEDRQSYRGNRVAVACGDGSWIATAAHCLEDFTAADRQSILAVPLILSPYHGDLFEAEVAGLDPTSDLAVLKVRWDKHPALALASDEEIRAEEEMWVAGYVPPEKGQGIVRAARHVSAERLPILRTTDPDGDRRVILGGARFVGPGWSGSPMILPGCGRLAGIFCRKQDLSVDDRLVLQNRVGGSAQALRELMKAGGVDRKDLPVQAEILPGSREAFSAALSWLDAQAGRPPPEKVAAAETWVRLRPQSGLGRLFLALSVAQLARTGPAEPGAGRAADEHFLSAVRLAPDSLLVHAAFGWHLIGQRRLEEGLAELAEAQRIAPENSFVLTLRLKALAELRPAEATALGERLTRAAPDRAAYWFHYAGALRGLGRNEEAMRSAWEAVRLAAPEQAWYRGRLADTLARCGQIAEAEACYQELLKLRPESAAFWLWYAQFLAEQGRSREADARQALEKCESLNQRRVIPQAVLDGLRARILRQAK